MMETPSFRILVIGAGIVGLSTAISLNLKGHHVTVLEKVAVLRSIGGVINAPPNSARVLKAYGLNDLIFPKIDVRVKAVRFRRYDTAETLSLISSDVVESDYGAPNWRLARSDLQEVLMIAARNAGIEIRLGCAIASIDESRPAAILSNGEQIEADLIVGADGVNSIVREAVLPGEKISLIDHISAYFIDVDRSVLSPDPELAPILEENAIWLGPGHQVVATNLFLSNRYTMTMAMDELLGVEGEWARQGDLSDAVEKFKNFHPLVTKVLNYVKSDQCLIWRFPELPLLDSWVSESGKVVIVGDAAHAMLPFAAQGAAMGIEDSACLAECLSRAASTSDIPKLLGIFQKIRQPRVESVAGRSRAMHKMSHMSDGPAQEARDKHLKSRPYYSPPSKWDRKPIDVAPPGMDPMYEPYLVGHDVFEFTNRKLDEMLV